MKQAEERIGTEMFASFWRHHGHSAPNLTSSTCSRSDEGRIVAFMFTKSQLEGWRGYWDLSTSGNCCCLFTSSHFEISCSQPSLTCHGHMGSHTSAIGLKRRRFWCHPGA